MPRLIQKAIRPCCFLTALLTASLAVAVNQPSADVWLIVDGAINYRDSSAEIQLDQSMLQNLPKHTLYTSTSVTDGIRIFEGPLVRDVLNLMGAQGKTVQATALNNYSVDIPITDFYNFDVILATHMDGALLAATSKGPLWIVYPRDDKRVLQDIRYDYRWVWQLHRLTVK